MTSLVGYNLPSAGESIQMAENPGFGAAGMSFLNRPAHLRRTMVEAPGIEAVWSPTKIF